MRRAAAARSVDAFPIRLANVCQLKVVDQVRQGDHEHDRAEVNRQDPDFFAEH